MNDISSYKISDEIIASIVINAAKQVEGIFCFEKKPKKIKYFFNNGENLKYVDIIEDEEFFEFTLYVKIKNGFNIRKTVEQVNENVKSSIEKMTDKTVRKVDVKIISIEFEVNTED